MSDAVVQHHPYSVLLDLEMRSLFMTRFKVAQRRPFLLEHARPKNIMCTVLSEDDSQNLTWSETSPRQVALRALLLGLESPIPSHCSRGAQRLFIAPYLPLCPVDRSSVKRRTTPRCFDRGWCREGVAESLDVL